MIPSSLSAYRAHARTARRREPRRERIAMGMKSIQWLLVIWKFVKRDGDERWKPPHSKLVIMAEAKPNPLALDHLHVFAQRACQGKGKVVHWLRVGALERGRERCGPFGTLNVSY